MLTLSLRGKVGVISRAVRVCVNRTLLLNLREAPISVCIAWLLLIFRLLNVPWRYAPLDSDHVGDVTIWRLHQELVCARIPIRELAKEITNTGSKNNLGP